MLPALGTLPQKETKKNLRSSLVINVLRRFLWSRRDYFKKFKCLIYNTLNYLKYLIGQFLDKNLIAIPNQRNLNQYF
jgi:hypothetical protein